MVQKLSVSIFMEMKAKEASQKKYVHFIPHGDMEQLTDTVKNVSDHPEEKKICCEAGQKIFSQKVMVENYEKIYKKILEQSTD